MVIALGKKCQCICSSSSLWFAIDLDLGLCQWDAKIEEVEAGCAMGCNGCASARSVHLQCIFLVFCCQSCSRYSSTETACLRRLKSTWVMRMPFHPFFIFLYESKQNFVRNFLLRLLFSWDILRPKMWKLALQVPRHSQWRPTRDSIACSSSVLYVHCIYSVYLLHLVYLVYLVQRLHVTHMHHLSYGIRNTLEYRKYSDENEDALFKSLDGSVQKRVCWCSLASKKSCKVESWNYTLSTLLTWSPAWVTVELRGTLRSHVILLFHGWQRWPQWHLRGDRMKATNGGWALEGHLKSWACHFRDCLKLWTLVQWTIHDNTDCLTLWKRLSHIGAKSVGSLVAW